METRDYLNMKIIYGTEEEKGYGYAYMILMNEEGEIEIYDSFDQERYKNGELNKNRYLLLRSKDITMEKAEYLLKKIIEKDLINIKEKEIEINRLKENIKNN